MAKGDTTSHVPESAFDQVTYNQEVERNYRWNFVVNALDGAFFWFGINFVASSTVIPIYVSRLTENRVLIGLASAVAIAGWFLPQLFLANSTERLARKKPLVIFGGFFAERLPILLLAFSTYLIAGSRPMLALGFFFLFFTWHKVGSGALAPAWEDMLAKVIPLDRRGRFFGITNFVGAALGILGAQATTIILARYPFPDNFALCMALAFAALFLSWAFLAMTREPARPPGKEQISHTEYWRRLPRLLRTDRNFSMYLLSRALAGLGQMAVGLATVYAVQRWELPDQQAGVYTMILLIAQTVCNLLFGYLGDRKGHKISLELGLLAWGASMAVAFLAPSPTWFYLSLVAAGAASAAELVGGLMILLEFGGPDDRPTYVGLGNTTTGIFNGIAPLLGGWIASVAGYRPLFIVSLVLTLMGWVSLRWCVREPRSRPSAEPTE